MRNGSAREHKRVFKKVIEESIRDQQKIIERSLKRGRGIFIFFVYQSSQEAWRFVQRREKVEGRHIRPEDFAEKFCESQRVVNKMKSEFGKKNQSVTGAETH